MCRRHGHDLGVVKDALAVGRADATEGRMNVRYELFVGQVRADQRMGAQLHEILNLREIQGGLHQEREAADRAEPGEEGDEAVAGHVEDVAALAAVHAIEVYQDGIYGMAFDGVEKLIPGRRDAYEVVRDAERLDEGWASHHQGAGRQHDQRRFRRWLDARGRYRSRRNRLSPGGVCGERRRRWPAERRGPDIRMKCDHGSRLLR